MLYLSYCSFPGLGRLSRFFLGMRRFVALVVAIVFLEPAAGAVSRTKTGVDAGIAV